MKKRNNKKGKKYSAVLGSLTVLMAKHILKGHFAADAAFLYFINRGRQSFSKNQTEQEWISSDLKPLPCPGNSEQLWTLVPLGTPVL